MPYSAEISRENPAALLFIIDQSASMEEIPEGEPHSKANFLADVLNKTLYNIIVYCTKAADGVRHYFDVGVIAYSGAGVGAGFGGALSGEIMHPIPLVAQTPVRIEERSRRTDDGAGGVIEKKVNFPVWFEPKSAGGTPMRAAMIAARDVVDEWCRAHPNSFPPTILHVTDGEYTGASPEDAAKALRQCHTGDGAALLFNLHISTGGGREIIFPKTERSLYDEYSRLLFRMSSILPPHYQELARDKGYEISDGSRGFIFNGNAGLIVDFFDIGTRPRLTSER